MKTQEIGVYAQFWILKIVCKGKKSLGMALGKSSDRKFDACYMPSSSFVTWISVRCSVNNPVREVYLSRLYTHCVVALTSLQKGYTEWQEDGPLSPLDQNRDYYTSHPVEMGFQHFYIECLIQKIWLIERAIATDSTSARRASPCFILSMNVMSVDILHTCYKNCTY